MITLKANRKALSLGLGLVFAIAASPAIYFSESRLIVPLVIFAGFIAVVTLVFLMYGEKIAISLAAVWVLLSSSLLLSTSGALLASLPIDLPKLIVPIFQVFFVIVGYILIRRANLNQVALIVMVYAAVYGLLLVLQSLGYIAGANQVTREISGVLFHRAQLFFNQPNGAAAYIVTVFPLTFLLKPTRRSRYLFIRIFQGALLLGLVVTFSRSALLTVLVTWVLVYILQRWGRLLFPLATVVWLFACALLLIRPAFDFVVGTVVQLAGLETEFSAGERIQLMRAGIDIYYDHPLTGVGVGNYPKILLEYNSSLNPAIGIPHNSLIQFAAEQGSVGVLAYIFITLIALKASTRRNRTVFALAWAFWATTLNGWFGWSFIHGLGELYMLNLGMLLGYAHHAYLQGYDRSYHPQQSTVTRG